MKNNIKNLQIGLEDSVVSYLDRIASEQHKTRTAVIRGDIWYVDLGGRAGKRPVLILTRQAVLDYLNRLTVVEVTTHGKGYPTEFSIGTMGTLSAPSCVQADNIHTVPKQRLVKYSGTLDASTMRRVSRKVVLALGLEEPV